MRRARLMVRRLRTLLAVFRFLRRESRVRLRVLLKWLLAFLRVIVLFLSIYSMRVFILVGRLLLWRRLRVRVNVSRCRLMMSLLSLLASLILRTNRVSILRRSRRVIVRRSRVMRFVRRLSRSRRILRILCHSKAPLSSRLRSILRMDMVMMIWIIALRRSVTFGL